MEQWSRERPDLDPAALSVVSRLLMLYRHLEQDADRALAIHGIALWQFDVLAALRRSGPPFVLSPTALTRLVTLSSGAMTNRIDRLEEMGLVARQEDPSDRRGVLIALTPKGRQLVDESVATRLAEARSLLAPLSPEEVETLAGLLRRLVISLRGQTAAMGSAANGSNREIPTRAKRRHSLVRIEPTPPAAES